MSTAINQACATLEAEFKKITDSLSDTREVLKREFDHTFTPETNPVGLFDSLEHLQSRIHRVKTNIETIVAARSSFNHSIQEALLPAYAKIRNLRAQSNLDVLPQEDDAELQRMLGHMDNALAVASTEPSSLLRPQDLDMAITLASEEMKVDTFVERPASPKATPTPKTKTVSKTSAAAANARSDKRPATSSGRPATASSKVKKARTIVDEVNKGKSGRAASKELIPVSEEEFTKLSSLVRGKAKLEDVNNVYKAIYSHFAETRSFDDRLTIKALSDKQLKVVGATGESKLKALRSLQLIDFTRQGVTLKKGAHAIF